MTVASAVNRIVKYKILLLLISRLSTNINFLFRLPSDQILQLGCTNSYFGSHLTRLVSLVAPVHILAPIWSDSLARLLKFISWLPSDQILKLGCTNSYYGSVAPIHILGLPLGWTTSNPGSQLTRFLGFVVRICALYPIFTDSLGKHRLFIFWGPFRPDYWVCVHRFLFGPG